jgi:hypothetical protein
MHWLNGITRTLAETIPHNNMNNDEDGIASDQMIAIEPVPSICRPPPPPPTNH